MDFSLSEEQTMLADSVARFIDNDYDFETRQKNADSEQGFSAENWQTFAELGWTAVPFGEADGGLDGGAVETMLLMEQFGRGLVTEPYLASIVMAGGALRRAGTTEQRERWLPGLIEGTAIGSLAFAEPQSRYRLHDVATTATRAGDHHVLNGHKAVVLNGDSATHFVVSARSAGERRDEAGISLFVVPADSAGVARHGYPTVDGLRAAELTLSDVRVPADHLLGEDGAGLKVLEATVDEATLAVAAEALGIMQTLNAKTLDYTKNRTQFGVPIASFQALQHRMVEMFMDCEQTRSLLFWAVMSQDGEDAAQAQAAVSAVKHQIGTAGRKLGQEAVQLHGGMGVTWELDVAHYFKRLTMIDTLFGNADYHLERFATLSR
ncbi:MAG: acyl-CoA dehydrogenase family protein [Pseudomonadota bacterium]